MKSPQKYCFGRGVPDYFWLLPGVLLLGRPGSGLGFGGRPYAAMKAKKNYMMWNKHILMHGSITSIMWASVLVLLNFVWNSPSVYTVRWFIDVLLEVMILTLSHFENQLHPSCHADASSHAVNPFFCTIRGSFGKRLKKKNRTILMSRIFFFFFQHFRCCAMKADWNPVA